MSTMSSTMSSSPSLSASTTTTATSPAQNHPPADTLSPNLSLLSLSIAAASAAPIPLKDSNESSSSSSSSSSANALASSGPSSSLSNDYSPSSNGGINGSLKHHRRLSSTGKTRRRLSDARDAASRPSPASAAALSLAGLSLSSPSLSQAGLPGSVPNSSSFSAASSTMSAHGVSTSPAMSAVPVTVNGSGANSTAIPITVVPNGLPHGMSPTTPASAPPTGVNAAKPISINGKNGKKRGQDHKCESCSKIYRHPSCLIKHRWEHTPHWRESSKYVLSKHQQVQLLEAAAILSHLSPGSATGTSLPEDRSLWPSFLSGGTLPPPEGTTLSTSVGSASAASYGAGQPQSGSSYVPSHPSSSSVPTSSLLGSASPSSIAPARAPSAGPRLHDYTVTGGQDVTVTQVRPGLLMMGASPSPASTPIPVPPNHSQSPNDVVGEGTSFTGAGIGYGIHAQQGREKDGTSTSVPLSTGMASSSSPYYNPRVGSVGADRSDPITTGNGSMPIRTTRSSTRSRSKSITKYGRGYTPSSYGNTTAASSSFTTNSNSFAPGSYTSTGTSASLSLSLPRSSLRSGSVGGGSDKGHDSDVELDDEEDEETRRYNDDDFEDEEDVTGRQRIAYDVGSKGASAMSNGFDEYGYEHERSMGLVNGVNGKRISPPLTSMKEEGDWEMEMDMD
ncbi:hypothetical protein D9758_009856 [Tetrapyrgos nigripes]|uniref:C2H2-type domain-containing protein n=1 Tax=Tetrapyrgos nigripes TaxID=182062 RepID=A0A8H5LSC6_9AGAR|nr:hypothetical protein D9758_009856 [Tetrapyrgos nigripes]